MSATTTTRTRTTGRPGAARRRLLTAFAGTAVGLLGWLLADPIGGVDLVVQPSAGNPAQRVGPAGVVLAGLVAGLAGWALLAALERVMPKARTVWTVAAVLTLLVSLLGPLAATTAPAQLVLAGLHVVVGAVLILGLRRTSGVG